ncbi:probable peptidoglycan muropeptide transporter SLC46 [Anabrus simplex]|uniref:probable peptidoglycan muropeptide transporter SLC46 n=1 Tax=Anabrus simplex TaxID=316456 RepID=UPI0034DD49F5
MDGEKKAEAKADEKFKEMKFCEKINFCFGYITVEPILICYIFPMVLSGMAVRNLNLEKACRVNLAYNESVCDALTRRETDNLTEYDDNVHVLVTHMAIWKNPLHSAIPAILILFLGSWSDRRARRKPCLVLPIIGQFITSIGLILCWYFFYEWPLEVAGVIEALFPSLGGGFMTIVMAALSYIADVTTEESRTFRIGVVNMLVTLGIPVGTALSGVLLKPVGYYGMFSITAFMYFLGFIYGITRVKETREPIPRPKDVTFLHDLFNPKHVVETLSMVVKKREGTRRKRLALLITLSVLLHGAHVGEAENAYAFVRRQFHWNEVDFGYYATYSIVIHLIGTGIAVGLLSRRLKMNDAILGTIALTSKVGSHFVFAFSTKAWHFYLGPVVEMLSGASGIAMRSLASKVADADEFGKVNSLFGVFDAFAPVVYSPLFSLMYTSTISTMAGAFYLLGSAVTIPCIIIFIWIYRLQKEDDAEKERAESISKERFRYLTPDFLAKANEAFESEKF